MPAETQEVKSADQSPLSLMLLGGVSDRMKRLLALQWTATGLWRIGKNQYRSARARISYTVTIDGRDPLYPDIHSWLLALLPAVKQRSLLVESSDYTSRGVQTPDSDYGTPKKKPPLRFLFDGEREQEVVVDGHKVKVAVSVERGYEKRAEYKITFTCFGVNARDAVTAMLTDVATARTDTDRQPRLFLGTRWGDWSRRDDLASRPVESVVLRAGVMESLVADLALFRSHEDDYIRLGMPFHRGYLFHGPPGTGKTSVARALASHFGMDLYFLPLGDLESDSNLTQMVARIPAGSVLLMEDIDTFGIARARDEEGSHTTGTMIDPGASLSGLLNALDGMVTPHGLITMLTTNNRHLLDEALLRDFRVNVDQEIGYLDNKQLNRLVNQFMPRPGIWVEQALDPDAEITPAQVLGIIMANLDDHPAAQRQIDDLVGKP